jgi:hypothetical protein
MSIHSIPNYIVGCWKEQVLPSLTTEQKKLLAVAYLIFSCLAAYYVISRCFKAEVKTIPSDDDDSFPENKDILSRVNEQKSNFAQSQKKVALPQETPLSKKIEPTPDKTHSLSPKRHTPLTVSTPPVTQPLKVRTPPAATIPVPVAQKKALIDDFYDEKLSMDDVKSIWSDIQSHPEEIKKLFTFSNLLPNDIQKENCALLLSILTESELENLAKQKEDHFQLRSPLREKGRLFIFQTLSIEKINALLRGVFGQNELPDNWYLIHCIEAINYRSEEDQKKLYTSLIEMLYTTHFNNNQSKLIQYLDIAPYRDGKPDSPLTKGMQAFTQSFILTALAQTSEVASNKLLDLLTRSSALLLTISLNNSFINSLTPIQQTKLTDWAKKTHSGIHAMLQKNIAQNIPTK